MRISPRRTASAMTRPVIALVIDPTSIGVVSSAPMPASRTGWAASRSISATATAWLPASHAPAGLLVQVGQDRGVAVAGVRQVRGQHPGHDRDGHRPDEHGQDKATRGEVAPGQDDEHEQRLPAVVVVPAVPAAAHREQHHGRGDRDQDRGDQQLPRPAVGERGRVTERAAPAGVGAGPGSGTLPAAAPPAARHQRIPGSSRSAEHEPEDDQADPDDHLDHAAAAAGGGATGRGWLVGRGRCGRVGEKVQGGRHQVHLCA